MQEVKCLSLVRSHVATIHYKKSKVLGAFFTMKRVFKFAMPFLQASLVKQILVGLILGMALGLTFPRCCQVCGLFGNSVCYGLEGGRADPRLCACDVLDC